MFNKRGIILVITSVIVAVLLILTGVYFSGLMTEKRSTDAERALLQALGLAEAGANHGISELKERIRTDLRNNLEATAQTTVKQDLQTYYNNQDPLGLLSKYAQFTVSGGQASFTVLSANLDTGIQGNYNATVVVKPQVRAQNPVLVSTDVYEFYYIYTIGSLGSITPTPPVIQKNIGLVGGSFKIIARKDTFAKFALFTSHHSTPGGTTVWFTANTNFAGPVHTNDRFSFANNPSATFTEKVTQHENKARFYNNGSPRLLNADSNPPYDVPTFYQGFTRGENIINLPSVISQAELKKEALGGMPEPGQNGIYVPNNGANVTGGIYIRGDSTVNMGLDPNSDPLYTVNQDSTTKNIIVDYEANGGSGSTTIITTIGTEPPTTETYIGIPDGVSQTGGNLIYAKDTITSISGTVQKDSSVTLSSERDIVITNHIQYQQFNLGPPINASGYTNLLGILSWGGNVRIGITAPNNLNIHGVVMAPHGIFTVDNYQYGSPRGTVTLLGGTITDFYGPFGTFSGSQQISGYGRNFVYDTRMLGGMVPPYFPYMANFTVFEGDQDNDGLKDLDEMLTWQDKGV